MRKPRMTKSERVFFDAISKLVFGNPNDPAEKVNTVAWADLYPEIREKYLHLAVHKTY